MAKLIPATERIERARKLIQEGRGICPFLKGAWERANYLILPK